MDRAIISAFSDEAGEPLEAQMAALIRNGIHGMEIRAADGVNISDMPAAKVREIHKILCEKGIFVWSVGSPIGKISVTDAFGPHTEKLERTLEAACILGAENIRIFSFYMPEPDSMDARSLPESLRDTVMERLSVMADKAKQYGITLCHENEKGIYGQSAAQCADIAEAVPDIAHVFDPANYIQSGEDPAYAWKTMAGHVKYIHIKDALKDGRVVPAGRGDCGLKEIISAFYALGGRHMTLEPHLCVFGGFRELEREDDAALKIGTYEYKTQDDAFDAAAEALSDILQDLKIRY